MKNITFILLLFTCCFASKGQSERVSSNTTIVSQEGETMFSINENGSFTITISPENLSKLKTKGYASYTDFGAKGDGKTDDLAAVAATHAFANEQNLKVKAVDDATYYIGGKDLTAIIKTDTDFGKAKFIIDDTNLENIKSSIFEVSSNKESFPIKGISSLKRNQKKIDVKLPSACLITVTNDNVKHYIRYGLNPNNGSPQTDIFVADKNGNVDMNAPIIWDFDNITEINALPMDEKKLKISGGIFTTIANQAESSYNYHSRNIEIRRSNVLVDNISHYITGEGENGAPYRGFISVSECANVTVQNTLLTGHKTYRTIGRAGKPVSMGSYDLSAGRALNVSYVNCSQTNDITDRTYWGILGTNYCKNLLYDNCKLSRFDAHKGVANATVRNSTLGYMGIKAIGSGTLLIENSTVYSGNVVSLRPDYGSTWQGELIIRNCKFMPTGGSKARPALIGGYYTGLHDFGYICYMPEKITIENLKIEDSQITGDYEGPAIFGNFNPDMTDATYEEKFPYVKTKEVHLINVKAASGKPLRISDNPVMFEEVKVIKK